MFVVVGAVVVVVVGVAVIYSLHSPYSLHSIEQEMEISPTDYFHLLSSNSQMALAFWRKRTTRSVGFYPQLCYKLAPWLSIVVVLLSS